ncbi:FecR domain-containing protein [Hylemonella sp. W303a]|uniref:FecR domain-containing protein n=1 Tax=Hylemonella sp. W303a TaxID=3389873 RepID=UPI00396B2D0B
MNAAALDPLILDEAADWLMRQQSGDPTAVDAEAFAQWLARSPEHARAWARAERLRARLDELPPQLAQPVLQRPQRLRRRSVLSGLGLLLAAPSAAWLAWRTADGQGWTADLRSARGEQRPVQLVDGSHVTLNTVSAIDVRFDATQRLIVLRAGEVLVDSAPDPLTPARPLRVQTAQATLQALGTRFVVRHDETRTRLTVLEGRVRVAPSSRTDTQDVPAGWQMDIAADSFGEVQRIDPARAAWTHGLLMADNQRLDEFLDELSRYRHGLIVCEPEVAALRVSGAFPVADTDRVLQMLVDTYPVQATPRARGLWLTVHAPQPKTKAAAAGKSGS